MPSSYTGHFVQIWRPLTDPWSLTWVEVEGRRVARSISSKERWERTEGWSGVSRELSLRRAKYFARAYAHAGFPVRIMFDGHGITKIVWEKNNPKKY